MVIYVEKIEKKDKHILANLFQLYLHDISLSLPMDVNKHGIFDCASLDSYVNDEIENYPFFIKADNKYIGFALIDKRIIESNDTYELNILFILNSYKNNGIGRIIAFNIFNMFEGNWEIKPTPHCRSAKKFWERVIKEYTNNKYTIEYGTTFMFTSERVKI
ncbi:MAG: GNAT family N-acetyltransferase [Ignavibacteriales bacterium]